MILTSTCSPQWKKPGNAGSVQKFYDHVEFRKQCQLLPEHLRHQPMIPSKLRQVTNASELDDAGANTTEEKEKAVKGAASPASSVFTTQSSIDTRASSQSLSDDESNTSN
jgi:hypothetical protein